MPDDVPPTLEAFLRRSLRKDVRQRVQSIGDMRLALDGAFDASAPVALEDVPAPGRRALLWALAALATIASLFLLLEQRQPIPPDTQVRRVEVGMPEGVELFSDVHSQRNGAVSPDGSRVAFVGSVDNERHVYLRDLDRFESVRLRETGNAFVCCEFSADSQSVAFLRGDGALLRVSLADQVVTTIATGLDFWGYTWRGDDTFVFVRSGQLWSVDASGEKEPSSLTTAGPGGEAWQHAWPSDLPGSDAILFSSTTDGGDTWRIESLTPATGERHIVMERAKLPLYVPSGHLSFYRDGALFAAPFDIETLRATGTAVSVLDDVPEFGFGAPSVHVSEAGVLTYLPTARTSQLVWVSRQGTEEVVSDAPRKYHLPRLDPEGRWAIVQAGGLWLQHLERSAFTRVNAGAVFPRASPLVTPDGDTAVFKTPDGLAKLALDGSGRGGAVTGTTLRDYPTSISPDGKTLFFVRQSRDSDGDIYQASLEGDPNIRAVIETPAYEGGGHLSPDGRWFLYSSDDSGDWQVFLSPFPALDRRWQVSTEGGSQAMWNPNGREIFYRREDQMMAVLMSAADTPALSEPTLLFEARYDFGGGMTHPAYDVSADGQRFIMVKKDRGSERLNLVFGWLEELERLAPTTH